MARKGSKVAAAVAKKRRLLVFEFGFRSQTGHHFNNSLSMLRAAPGQGVEITYLAGDTFPGDPAFGSALVPFFSADLYRGLNLYPTSAEFDSWLDVNGALAADLKRLPATMLAEADMILVPAVTQFHMWALCKWIRDVAIPQTSARIFINLMFSPTWTAWDAVCESGQQMYADAIRLVSDQLGQRVFLGSEFEASAREFQAFIDADVHILPHPGLWDDHAPVARRSGGAVRVGYFGYAKREKGFHLVPEIIEAALGQSDADLRFVVHVNHGGYDGEIIDAEQRLKRLKGPGVRLIEGPMTSEQYQAEVEDVDIMLLPYDPALYRGRGSGVFSEAVALGKPMVAPDEAGVGEEMRRGRAAGIAFGRYNADAIGRAVAEAAANIDTLSETAFQLSAAWREKNSGAGALKSLITAVRG
jgi:glycosyltransferase involved in cell wall biosynthesis